ncbi:hypothetical protein PCARR_a3017 [Pseudoalteromonas carrageenovora IAM 12662]|uniref:Uncharacterized protein n=1 Tax=Pseudoalteromonas carrageenovora IAM 12662 TaxID=1314868 RepID=A0ABR9EL40_PSEVC|nr:hypothetical protein [Pseudoalteromonas carrageenovora IAM 12662]
MFLIIKGIHVVFCAARYTAQASVLGTTLKNATSYYHLLNLNFYSN